MRHPRRVVRGLIAAVALAAAVAGMLLLARWQWHRGQARHALLNYSYAVEWVSFAVLTVVAVTVLARDRRAPHGDPEAPPVPTGVQVGPPPAAGDSDEVTYVRLLRRLGLARY